MHVMLSLFHYMRQAASCDLALDEMILM